MAGDVLRVLDAVGLFSAPIVGISMGGMAAQILAFQSQDRVESLTLVSTTAWYPGSARQALRDRADLVEGSGMSAIVEGTLERWFSEEFRRGQPEAVGRVRSMLESADPSAYAEAARAVARVDNLEPLRGLNVPTLIVAGTDDASLPVGASAELASAIGGARLTWLEGARHLCTVERADDFNRLLLEFLSAQKPRADEAGIAHTVAPW